MDSKTLQSVSVRQAYRLIARYVYGPMGTFAYQAFEHINLTYHESRLPEPLILWDITDHGHNLGWCRSRKDGPPIIKLHPSILAGTELETPWGIESEILGACFAYDVLLHETIHVSIEYVHGGWDHLPGCNSLWTSHNNPVWVAEVNRIAEIMDVPVRVSMKRYKRVEIPGVTNENGKTLKAPRWTHDGDLKPEHFPHGYAGRREFYLRNELPFDIDDEARAQTEFMCRAGLICHGQQAMTSMTEAT